MEELLSKQIKEAQLACEKANKELERLRSKKQALPSLINTAKALIKVGHSDTYVQSCLYAKRGDSISIDDIVEIITHVKTELNEKA